MKLMCAPGVRTAGRRPGARQLRRRSAASVKWPHNGARLSFPDGRSRRAAKWPRINQTRATERRRPLQLLRLSLSVSFGGAVCLDGSALRSFDSHTLTPPPPVAFARHPLLSVLGGGGGASENSADDVERKFPLVFSERELTFTFAIYCRLSVCRLSSVCL